MKAFIEETIARCRVKTERLIGFDDDKIPANERRFGFFDDDSRWQTEEERAFSESHKHLVGCRKKGSGLYGNEGDLALAARAVHSVIVTRDQKPGPLKRAHEQGLNVVVLPRDFDPTRTSLRSLVMGTSVQP